MSYPIRHDYDAVHHSGRRAASAIKQIVIHDMEVTAYNSAAEAVGAYFQQRASGGSTNYGIDNNSVQQYLSDLVIPWGAPYVNTSGLHIEMMGKASWTESQWKAKAQGTIARTGWLVGKLCRKYGIPIRILTDKELAAGKKGITTHRQASRVFHVAGGHTDPGTGFPLDEMVEIAIGAKKRATLLSPARRPQLKRKMKAWAEEYISAHPDDAFEIPTMGLSSEGWGYNARLLAKRVSYRVRHTHPEVATSDRPTRALYEALKKGA